MMNNDEAEAVLKAIRKIIRAIDLHSKKLENKFGLTGPQMMIFKEIVKSDEIATSVLARKVNLSHATVTSVLDRLQVKGYIERIKDIADKRKVLVKATESKKFETTPTLLQEKFVSEFHKLQDWERSQIIYTLQRIASMMDVEKLDVSPILSSNEIE